MKEIIKTIAASATAAANFDIDATDNFLPDWREGAKGIDICLFDSYACFTILGKVAARHPVLTKVISRLESESASRVVATAAFLSAARSGLIPETVTVEACGIPYECGVYEYEIEEMIEYLASARCVED